MPKPDHDTPLLEWLAAATGAAALAAVLGVIIFGIATRVDDRPPVFSFETVSITQAGDRWHVAFKISNSGNRPASSVRVIGELDGGGESADVTLRYVPDGSSREGGLFFMKDPRSYPVRFRAAGYEVP